MTAPIMQDTNPSQYRICALPVANITRNTNGLECRDGRGPADHTAGLPPLEDHRHLLERTCVTDAGEEEDREHAPEERGELTTFVGASVKDVQAENPMPSTATSVTLAPLNLSATGPARMRAADPTRAPRKA